MDTASILIGLGVLLVFVGPIALLIIQQKRKENARIRTLKTIAGEQQLHLDTTENSASILLGLDSSARKLLVIEPRNNMQYQVIDLSQVRNSLLRTADFQERKGQMNHISMDFLGKKENRKIAGIIFYEEDDHVDPEAQLVIAKKWDKLIQQQLSA